MTGVSVLTILIFVLYSQSCHGQQNGVASNCQQAIQSNTGFSQTAEPANLNIQMQQSAKQASSSQQSYNLQQLANIPMQTFNVQQPVNFQLQANSPPPNFQPVNQATGLQQIPQSINLQEAKHDAQQTLSSPVNIQNVPVAQPQQTFNVKTAPPSVIMQQQAPSIQTANVQQQVYPVNLQQQIQTRNLQPQAPQQCVNLQNSVVVQPGSLQQQTVVHNGNVQQQQQVPQHQANLQHPSQPYVNMQQQSAQLHQPAVIVQPVASYQQPVTFQDPIVKQLSVQKCTVQEPHNVQQMLIQQTDSQQKQLPCQAIGGYQVISYQKPCQQPDVTAGLPTALQSSKVSINPYPTVIAAVPAAIADSNKLVQRTDQMYLVNPQNYANSASYSAHTPAVVIDNIQQVASGLTATPTSTFPNPSTAFNFVISNPDHCAETIENLSSLGKTSDLGILSILQGQLPVASLLNQPTSSFESALLSSILSSVQNPSPSPQYVMANYPTPAVLGPQCNSQNSKFSLKSLLPLLLNLLQEKYSGQSGCGCQCQCCNCERSQNDNNVQESPRPDENKEVIEEAETREEPSIDTEISLEEEDIPIHPRKFEKSKYQNMISDDSAEIDETEDSSGGIETEDGTGSGDEEDLSNDSSKL